MKQNAAVRVSNGQTNNRPTRPVIKLDDPTTYTVNFCREMKLNFQGPGCGDIYSRWQRCEQDLMRFEDAQKRGEPVGHPLAKNNCKGARAFLLSLSEREKRVAYGIHNVI